MTMRKLSLLINSFRAQEREMAARNLQMLQTRMNQEQEYNQRIQKSRLGEVIIYGSSL